MYLYDATTCFIVVELESVESLLLLLLLPLLLEDMGAHFNRGTRPKKQKSKALTLLRSVALSLSPNLPRL
jgi:hypothetical protein